ncbi:hypothetical protein BO99DRAFT_50862 [Aspergillus violaceofuscus CBS 115571]|uniref:Uncharacterized protein n=1 Tax=Aspergillus violaceofuscus (strain CBS 115571) TaxID=1450538 RepID=A0A2V5HCB6_ASPV1|nr:hypothetical protein BO99DRAFT_50862 [Aspergillus violaceofuscus CBS 115571]
MIRAISTAGHVASDRTFFLTVRKKSIRGVTSCVSVSVWPLLCLLMTFYLRCALLGIERARVGEMCFCICRF